VAVGGVVASLSLAVALTVMVTSFRGSMLDWLDAVLPSPLYLRAAGGSSKSDAALLPPTLLQAGATCRVERAQPMRATSLWLDPQRPAISLLLRRCTARRPSNCRGWGQRLRSRFRRHGCHLCERGRGHAVWRTGRPALAAAGPCVQHRAGRRQCCRADSPATAPTAGAAERTFCCRHLARLHPPVRRGGHGLGRLPAADGRCPHVRAVAVACCGRSQATLQPRIEAALARLSGGQAPPLEFTSSAALRQRSLRIFDRSFAVTYWLQAVAIGIGLFGIAASFSAQVLARRKEFGLLTHLGLTRRQILTVVAGEGGLDGHGRAGRHLLGLGVAAILVHVVNPQSFHWTMELRLPAARLLALACAVVLAGTLTAWWAGRQATGETRCWR
jgi:putative ABC transport system permease protein